jgi:hypothetical protein
MKTAFFGIFVCIFTAVCHADLLLYDEAVSGDLTPFAAITPDVSQPLTLLSLQNGTNIVKGTMTFRNDTSLTFDIDAFAFSIPNGSQIVDIKFDAFKTSGSATTFLMAFSRGVAFNNLQSDNPLLPPVLGIVRTQIPSEGSSTFTSSVLPLGAGNYNLSFNSGLLEGSATFPTLPQNQFNWTAKLEVTAVPEPSSVLLIMPIFTLIGLGCFSKVVFRSRI